MTPQLTALAPHAAAVFLHALRLAVPAMLCPFLGGPGTPATVRLALAAGLGASAWSAAGRPLPALAWPTLLLGAGRELVLGAALGFVASVPFEAARAGGRLVDTLRGATLSELHVAPLRQRESATGDLLAQWMLVLAGTTGGDRLVVAALLETFRAVPVGAGTAPAALLGVGLNGAAELSACALALAAPAAAGLLAADLAIVAVSRLVPSFPVAAIAQPGRAALGCLAVMVPAAALAGRLTSAVALSARLVASFGAAP